MSLARFYLKSDSSEKAERLIFMNYSYNGIRFKYSTGIKINPEYWNQDRQQVRESAKVGIDKARIYNQRLKQLANTTEQLVITSQTNRQVLTTEELRKALQKVDGRTKQSLNKGLMSFIDLFISKRAASPNYKPESIKVYRALQVKLKDYIKSKGLTHFDFKHITPEFWESFRDHLYIYRLTDNTVHKQITTLKTILKAAQESAEYKEAVASAYIIPQTRKIGVSKEAVSKIYLNQDELKNLFHLELKEQPRLERVRDLFLIGATTGLRFSDFTRIHPDHFDVLEGKQVIRIDTQKTGERVIIPVHPYVKSILKRNGGIPPKGITNQKMNAYLKELGMLAGFDQPIILTKKVGGSKESETFLKYQLLCTHTARRSFATNAYKGGIASLAIMKITGHRTEGAFMRYIQVTSEENAVLLAKHEFFSEKNHN